MRGSIPNVVRQAASVLDPLIDVCCSHVALTESSKDMPQLLKIAEQHSRELGYRWQPPSKCAILEPNNNESASPTTYYMYNQPIPATESFQYIGIPFTSSGIDIDQLVNQRSSKVTGNMALLRQLGVHLYGIGLWPALRSYCTFIQPVLEYRIAIAALSTNQLTKLENAQNV
ncbi:hypothetical protein INT45_003137 [Circinella minor]|uniref:Uncharacterized protein n=1 Tax=Circinella minor TaxID=1195481 RepID=A0A8H7RZ52_9FUNG|nr:hypothetical protein INT45_003137 [Circinella minor]